MESVTYNDPTPEENISLEQQAAMQEEAQEQRNQQQPQQQQPEETPTETTETPERPEWLPEKFDSPESMAEAYGQLEKRFHENNNNEQSEDNSEEAEATPAMGEVVTAASEEYYENGTLSDSAYQSLEEAGLSRDVVDTYVQGFEALQAQQDRKSVV